MKKLFSYLGLVLSLALALSIALTNASGADKDLSELEHYTLTMDKVTRFFETYGELGSALKVHPELKGAMETDADNHEDLAAIEKRLNGVAPLKTAVANHGLSMHEFVVLQFAVFQSAMASAMIPPGPDRAAKAAEANVNPANLDFIDKHKAEFQALQQKYMPKGDSD